MFLAAVFTASGKEYKYDTVPNDPLKARIYTLDNGLKVYLTAYADEPRVRACIVVRVGAKNDPPKATGLSHSLEHLLFKGTSRFGTSDYAKEKPLLDDIERRYEVYRTTTDELQRKAIYRQIDSVSGLAAQYAIANEYSKLMSAIGANYYNAFTDYDATCYQENFPSNQIESWAKIQVERFSDPVIRLFHTEMEAIYEEKNRALTYDNNKVYEAMLAGLFPHHPYGRQTVIGEQEHLKNPSITNVKEHFRRYYVPNNMAVCMSGDFDCDTAIAIIDRYFGRMKKREVEPLQAAQEDLVMPMKEKTVYGFEDKITIGFRFAEPASEDADMLALLNTALSNNSAGLIDLNIVQQQKLLSASSEVVRLADCQALLLQAKPRQGQTLDEAKSLLLEQLEKLKNGEFEEWLLKAGIANLRLSDMREMESNAARAKAFATSFAEDVEWRDRVERFDRMEKITKQQLVKFANERIGNCYVVVYKRSQKDPNEPKMIEKPEITPVRLNRDAESDFLTQVKSTPVKPIEPVFLDFKKDLSKLKTQSGVKTLYKQNTENERFMLACVFNMGTNHDRELYPAISYLKHLGTDRYTAAQLRQEFYRQGVEFDVSLNDDNISLSLNGLSSGMEASLALLEHLLAHAQANEEVYANLVNDMLASRANVKRDQAVNLTRLHAYAVYGAFSPATNILSEDELRQLKPQALVDKIHGLTSYHHRIFYYGPQHEEDVIAVLNRHHKTPKPLKALPSEATFTEQPTTADRTLFVPYDNKLALFMMVSKLDAFDKSLFPLATLYNEYFNGGSSGGSSGIGSIVFQELREARGLAYTASAEYVQPNRPDRSAYMQAEVSTQADKVGDAVAVFRTILTDMPESEATFKAAQDAVIRRLRTQRITKARVLWAYDEMKRMKVRYDIRRDVFDKIPTMTLEDLKAFQQEHIKNLHYTYCILGDENSIDFGKLKTLGTVEKLSREQIFGY
ncbi:MAG: insulinase family protein [Prevotellaceae bacterium]|nr:insulinase family protein [Prevotellaceae bacterium]